MRAVEPFRLKQGRQTGHDDGDIGSAGDRHRLADKRVVLFRQFHVKARRVNHTLAELVVKRIKRRVQLMGINL